MKSTPLTSVFSALFLAALLTGCGSSGIGDILGGGSGSDGRYEPSRDNVTDVRGTIERVDTRNRMIVVDGEAYRNNLRNNGSGDEIVVYYDDRTTVEFQGQSFQPQDLEVGDRIEVNVAQSGDRLFAEQINVVYDVTSGTGSSGTSGTWNDDQDDLGTTEVRGAVVAVNTSSRTVDVERRSTYGSNFSTGSTGSSTGRIGEVVTVYYDSNTVVEYQGRRYSPENLERGDMVEVEVSRLNGRLVAQEILVVGENASVGR